MNITRIRKKQPYDRRTGAAMVEGVMGLWLVITGTVLALTIIVNTGMSTYYKEKLGFISNQCAAYAATLPPGEDIASKVEPVARGLLSALGLANTGCKVKVEEKAIEDRTAVKITVAVNGLKLFGPGDVLPGTINLEDSAIVLRNGAPTGLLWMNNNAKFSGYLIPAIKVPPSGPNSLGMPLYIP
jgi:hypothetical protein